MSPFDLPPSGEPVSMPAPGADQPGPRRGRMAVVALVTAGLLAAGVAGISQFASADEPGLAATPADDETTDESTNDQPTSDESTTDDSTVSTDGEIVIELDGDEPIVLDLEDLSGSFDGLAECLPFEFDLAIDGDEAFEPGALDELLGDDFFSDEFFEGLPALEELFGEFGDFSTFEDDLGDLFGDFEDLEGHLDGSVTVTGPDGVSIVDLGENGTVTITKNGDDVTIDASGDAVVSDLDELFGDFGTLFSEDLDGFEDDVFSTFDEFDEEQLDELFGGLFADIFGDFDAEAFEACVNDALGQ